MRIMEAELASHRSQELGGDCGGLSGIVVRSLLRCLLFERVERDVSKEDLGTF